MTRLFFCTTLLMMDNVADDEIEFWIGRFWKISKKICETTSANRRSKLYDHFLGSTPYARIEHKYLSENLIFRGTERPFFGNDSSTAPTIGISPISIPDISSLPRSDGLAATGTDSLMTPGIPQMPTDDVPTGPAAWADTLMTLGIPAASEDGGIADNHHDGFGDDEIQNESFVGSSQSEIECLRPWTEAGTRTTRRLLGMAVIYLRKYRLKVIEPFWGG
ncbi:uncharacterized protein LOC109836347 isoform X2 [Asparagus officinalis]|uniref:uncharacterized protein LOC109836347 isoform X2 n=1 Tax=Asparagus officinalis TaxID=4686 RepID=UPI00098DFCEE|nr:uncharacterized protein LOC109836347 isoform X2 [Asparagus officinalis]